MAAASFVNTDGNANLLGGLIGIAIAIAIGYAIFVASIKLNIKLFFNITSILLILFAAALISNGIHEFQEAGILPTLIQQVWSTGHILSEDSFVGGIFKSLLGYNSNPSLLEVLAYIGYAGLGLFYFSKSLINKSKTRS